MLLNSDHLNILQEAVQYEKDEDVNIRFICENGQFVVRATHFKIFSKFFYKLFADLPNNLVEYTISCPDINKHILQHISDIIANGQSSFNTNKVKIDKLLVK